MTAPGPSLGQAPPSRKPWWRSAWRALARSVRGAVLLDDSPERIARGCACGIGVAFIPGPGQVAYALVAARLARGNLAASLPWTAITNPLTTVPIFYGCYRLGSALIPGHQAMRWEDMRALYGRVSEAPWSEIPGMLVSLSGTLVLPLLLGSVVLGGALAAVVYPLVLRLVRAAQARRRDRWRRWAGHV
ncbi:MAG: DUF2062 domain-containing protein [Planctomycetes bacterium]|nr:DUF2062 domain-containing protein [Planctomycetota bacterium]